MALQATPRSNKALIEATEFIDTKQGSKAVQQGWARELTSRVNEAPEELDEFLSVYIPSRSDPPKDIKANIRPGVFDKWIPTKGKEAVMYNHLVRLPHTLPECSVHNHDLDRRLRHSRERLS